MEENSTYILPIIGEIGEQFKYTDLLMHLSAAKEFPIIQGVIDSPGGNIEEGKKIRKALKESGKIIKMKNSGDVASIAVSFFTVAPKAYRSFDPSKGKFHIHLPIVQPEHLSKEAYTADDLEQMAKALKGYGNELAKEYAIDTGTDIEVLKGFMAENKSLTPEQVSSLGFATIEQPTFKAVAYFNNKNNDSMDEKVFFEKVESIFDKLTKAKKAKEAAKNLMLQDVNGVEIDFGDAVETPEQIVVGVEAKIDGKPAEGKVVMADGSTLVFEGGKLMEIMPAQSEVEDLKAKLATLEAEKATAIEAQNKLQKEFDDYKALALKELTEARTEFKAFKAQYSKEKPLGNTPPASTAKGTKVDKATIEKMFNL